MEIEFASTYAEISDLIGVENTLKLYEVFHGQQVTFPQRLYDTTSVANYVRENYNGSNLRALAIKFGYSERRIRQFLNATND